MSLYLKSGLFLAEGYDEDAESFAEIMQTFLNVMANAKKSGGLYCGGVVSK